MTEDLRAPGFASEIVVLNDAAVGFKTCAGLQGHHKMFVTQANQLNEITIAGAVFTFHDPASTLRNVRLPRLLVDSTTGAQTDKDIVGSDLRFGNIFQSQVLGAAMFMKYV